MKKLTPFAMNLTKVRAKDMQELGGADSLIHKVV
jgi:hypothetical protein